MKKIINAVDQVENQMIEGMVKAFPQYVKKLDCGNVVVRAEKKTGKVALISGGGTVHVKWDEKILSVESSVSGGTLIYCGKEYLLEPGKTVTTTK